MQMLGEAKTKNLVLAASISAMFGGFTAPALAEDLAETLYKKGVITEEEYTQLDDPYTLDGSSKGKFEWKSRDGNATLKLRGRVQLDYRSFDNDVEPDTFDIRRVYFGAEGKLYKDWSYAVVYNFDSSVLEYGYLDYKWNNAARLRMGAFKYQFSFEEITSSRFTDFMERSFVNNWVPGKDVGLMFYGEPKKNVYSYAIGVANGEGKNSTENDPPADGKEFIGRFAVNFAPMMNWGNGVLHLGADYATGEVEGDTDLDQRTEARGVDFWETTLPAVDKLDRERTGLEGVVIFGPVKVQSEWVKANYSGDGGYDRDIDTAYLSANWLITGEKYVDNYTLNGMKTIKPLKSLSNGGKGAWEVGVRFSQFEADDQFAVSATSTNKADAVTVGLKWIPIANVRFLAEYVDTSFDTPITVSGEVLDGEKAFNMRAQIYF
jgi:phosphate-selective porin OprO/OprP